MDTIEREACVGLAFLWCRENKPKHPQPYQWARRHWMEFLPELDTDTGKMLVELAARNRKNPKT